MKSAKLSSGTRYYGYFKDLDWREFFDADPSADISWQRPYWESAFPRTDAEFAQMFQKSSKGNPSPVKRDLQRDDDSGSGSSVPRHRSALAARERVPRAAHLPVDFVEADKSP
jgi:hypothetical protein